MAASFLIERAMNFTPRKRAFQFVSRSIIFFLVASILIVGITLRAYSDNIVYKYDSLNRLIEVDYPDKIITYTYDAAGNRISTQVQYLVPAPTAASLNRTTAVAGGTGFTLIIAVERLKSNNNIHQQYTTLCADSRERCDSTWHCHNHRNESSKRGGL